MYIKVFIAGFLEGAGDIGRTYGHKLLNEIYDWGRNLRRLSND